MNPSEGSTLYHYCIVRKDLPLGILCAQLVHAAGESSNKVPRGTHAIVLAAKDEKHLLKIEEKAIKLNVPHIAIREPDSPYNNSLMSIGIEPHKKENKIIKQLTSSLPLLKELSLNAVISFEESRQYIQDDILDEYGY